MPDTIKFTVLCIGVYREISVSVMYKGIEIANKILTNILTALYEPFGFSLLLSLLCFSTYTLMSQQKPAKGGRVP